MDNICDKAINNLHHQVQYSDNEFSEKAVDSIRSLTTDGCSNECSIVPGYSTAIGNESHPNTRHTEKIYLGNE